MAMALVSFWTVPQVAAQASVTVTMRDISFDPGSFSVMPGDSVSLTLVNAGALPHTFTLFAQADANVPVNDFNALQDYDNANAKLVDMSFGGGQQGSDSFTAPMEEGAYTFVCMISGHAASGMHGTMTVSATQDGGPAPIDPLIIGVVVAVVVIVVAVSVVFILRRRS